MEKSLKSLLHHERVLIWAKGRPYCRTLFDDVCFDGTQTVLYQDDVGIDANAFELLGLKKYSGELEQMSVAEWDRFYQEHRLVMFNHERFAGKADDAIHFSYYFGTSGAAGFRLVPYRNCWGCFVVYVWEWAS